MIHILHTALAHVTLQQKEWECKFYLPRNVAPLSDGQVIHTSIKM